MPMRDRTLVAFGRNVVRIRTGREFSQDKLAEKADLDRTYVSGIERGVRNPGIKAVFRIARAISPSKNLLPVKGKELWIWFSQLVGQTNRLSLEWNEALLQRRLRKVASHPLAQDSAQFLVESNEAGVESGIVQT